jgi:16S rRNA processing protein RimM
MKVEPMTDFAQRFTVGSSLRLRGESRRIEDVRQRKRQLLVRLKGIETPEEAGGFAGSLLTIPESDLAPLGDDEYYRFQLIGLRVEDEDGTLVGTVTEILDTGETQVLVVEGERAQQLVPLVDEFVSAVDLARGAVRANISKLV